MSKYLQHSRTRIFFDWALLFFIASLPMGHKLDGFFLAPVILGWFTISSFKDKWGQIKRNKVSMILLFGLYLVFWLGLLYTENTNIAFGRIERAMGLVVIPIIVFSLPSDCFDLRKIFIALGIGLLLVALISWANILMDILSKHDPVEQAKYFFEWIYTDENLLRPMDIHPGYFVLFLVLFMVTVIKEHFFSDLHNNKPFFIIIISVCLLFLVETSSRVGFICLLLILLLELFKQPSKFRKLFYLLTIIIFIGLSFKFDYLSSKLGKLIDSNGNITFQRYFRWKEIMATFFSRENWVFGAGTGDIYSIYQEAYGNGGYNQALNENYNAHNQFLELIVGNGILGVTTFILVLVNFVFKTKLKHIALTFFILILAFSFSESFLVRSKGVFFFSFFYALLIKKYDSKA